MALINSFFPPLNIISYPGKGQLVGDLMWCPHLCLGIAALIQKIEIISN